MPTTRAPLRLAAIVGVASLVAGCAGPTKLKTIRYGKPDPPSIISPSTAKLAIASPAPPELPPVQVLQPSLWVRKVPGDLGLAMAAVRGVKGVSWAAPVRLAEAKVDATKGSGKVKVAAIEPDTFRPLVPQPTADALDVWRRLFDGEAAFAPQAARRLKLALGEPVVTAGRGTVRVGAIAPVSSIADALVTRAAADALGLGGEETVVLAIDRKAGRDAVARKLRAQKMVVEVVAADATRSKRRDVIEPFTYAEREGGMIDIDPAWVARNIVSARVPILRGAVRCHRVMVPQLHAALQEIQDRGLAHLIDPRQYGGCFVPRHIDFNPAKSISMHAWGLAVDLNVSTNQLGAPPTLDQQIVEVFRRWGFKWGGDWQRPDGMHFQLAALVQEVQG